MRTAREGFESHEHGVEGFLDQHAELRDVVAQIRKASDLAIRHGLLERLCALLDAHFAWEEAADGVFAMFRQASGGESVPVAQLVDEHRRIRSAAHSLLQRAGAQEDPNVARWAEEVESILTTLQDHEARENDLLSRAMNLDAASFAGESGHSAALEANLRRTAVDVVIPAEQLLLLEITAQRYGVHENTKKLLREINHPYVGWSQALDDLHRRSMSDFAYYVAHERAAEAIEVFCGLYLRAAERAESDAVRKTAIRKLLYYVEEITRKSGQHLSHLLPALDHVLARLGNMIERSPDLASAASPRLRHLAEALLGSAPDAAVSERCLELLARSLREAYSQWIASSDPAEWWCEVAGRERTPPEALAKISHAALAGHLKELERIARIPGGPRTVASRADALLALPDAARIERSYIEMTPRAPFASDEPQRAMLEQTRWLLRVLSVEALAGVHEQGLIEISSTVSGALADVDDAVLDRIVRDIFAVLRGSELSSSPSGQRLIARIGEVLLASGDASRAQVMIDELLECDFPSPAFAGFSNEWSARVDPAHLRAIRTYLAIIEANPKLARPLIAGLVVHLRLGGVFIADTDLFQRDVSALLNSGIQPIYHLLAQLLRVFPVYFEDIGAEGPLRDVSSRIDEIGGRRDPLCHFLRKQSHVGSNPRLIDFIEAIGHFWASGEREPLEPYVPPSLYAHLDVENEEYRGIHRLLAKLAAPAEPASPLSFDASSIERRINEIDEGRPIEREKLKLLVELRALVGRKYELDHAGLLERLALYPRVCDEKIEPLREALAQGRHENALALLLEILERLNEIILSEQQTEGEENIYHKRHIAVGIPSVYGRYREAKFEAVGLRFRIESLGRALFEQLIAEISPEYVTHTTLRRVLGWLRLMLRALRIDGCQGRGLASGIAMLDQALEAERISLDQYINIFQFLAHSVENLIRIRFLDPYEGVLEPILRRMHDRGLLRGEDGDGAEETILKTSETFLRDQIAGSFGPQLLDDLVTAVLRALLQMREKLDPPTMSRLMTYDSDRSVVPIEARKDRRDGVVYLGNKGYMIKQMARAGLPVPPGFIVTTEVFRCRTALAACDELHRKLIGKLAQEVARLGQQSDSRFGDPRCPLLLSVRSGAPISMPGVLDTILNVGMNEAVAEGLAIRSGSAWAAWDSYRRFLQQWGMAHGIERDTFDTLMRDAKRQFGAEKKAQLRPAAMKQLALRYRALLRERDVDVPDDAMEQLEACVDLVLRSWDTELARVYRSASQIAEEWGTAVIVQNMVFGNLHERSGTGVVLTGDPRQDSGEIRLSGDFVVQGQGEDVVGGLVETFPITEEQRRSGSAQLDLSLEKDFPRVYEALLKHARTLIHDLGMFHQEIEFTFESEEPSDLYILQTRDTVLSPISSAPAFVPGEDLERARIATGIGVGGGALSGRVAHTAADIAHLRERFPDDPIILLRPDTVPDDIPLILATDGMLTALGGATSHAALASQRLGRTCVVGCRQLDVDEARRQSRLAGELIETGDFLSVDGQDGSVYRGRHASTILHRQILG